MRKYLQSDSLIQRFLGLAGLGVVLFLAAWTLSYAALPEGILRGRTAAAALAGEEAAGSLLLEFLRIFALNMFMVFVIVAANRILVIHGYPLGYLPPLFMAILYAITLGTNSFLIPLPERMAPTFAVLLRSGPYEILGYILIAVSTFKLPTYRFKRFIPPDSEPIEPPPAFMKSINWVGFGLAISILAAANVYEAYMILGVAG